MMVLLFGKKQLEHPEVQCLAPTTTTSLVDVVGLLDYSRPENQIRGATTKTVYSRIVPSIKDGTMMDLTY
jgi:hypothetical protein